MSKISRRRTTAIVKRASPAIARIGVAHACRDAHLPWRAAVLRNACHTLFQKPFKRVFGHGVFLRATFLCPRDWNVKTDFVFARLMVPGGPLDGYQRTGRFTGDYHFRVVAMDPGLIRARIGIFYEALRRLDADQCPLRGAERRSWRTA